MAQNKNPVVKALSRRRRWIQFSVGASLFAAVNYFNISLWWVLGVGALAGIVFGKVFCRWMCPLGFLMELMTGATGDKGFQQTYQYHKLGCPIAWISGALNKFSFFRIRLDSDSCTNCGLCDKACYMASLDPATFSLHKSGKDRPGEAFACSKCLSCVVACPSGSLRYGGPKLKK